MEAVCAGCCVIRIENVHSHMAEINDAVVEEVLQDSQNLLLREVITLIEREHPDAAATPGITREALTAYAQEFGEDTAFTAGPEEFRASIDDRLTDSETWVDNDAFYELNDDRVSVYPSRWHDELGGDVNVPAFLEFLQDEASGVEDDLNRGGAGGGIPEGKLVDIVSVVGRADRETVKTQIETLRNEGILAEDADQHPDARVQLRKRDDRRDPSLEP
jgi:hypothetical protein